MGFMGEGREGEGSLFWLTQPARRAVCSLVAFFFFYSLLLYGEEAKRSVGSDIYGGEDGHGKERPARLVSRRVGGVFVSMVVGPNPTQSRERARERERGWVRSGRREASGVDARGEGRFQPDSPNATPQRAMDG